ncbi:glycosyltransferase family 2 protein [Congregibacter brevis]|uniref:Glycosyltransferase family 2 protein n=1 Tax=Congregibacter brevis TaxID=3081201 RepID=A0ABZ0ICK4_9GAMM|nr:glycosyltransferase family 2 protein [Congregibacter sp. IMCC45268]
MTAIVCMATYNGARWIQDQIDSVVAQTDQDWQLLISDDGSTDGTLDLLRTCAAGDSRVRVLSPRQAPAGVIGNFEYLLGEAAKMTSDFVALCDQDDLWDRDKIAAQRDQLKTAIASCSDPELINEQGEPLGKRLLDQLKAPDQPDADALLAQNSVVGCTLAIRPDVLDLALPFPPGLQNHDWWLALCALCKGPLLCDQQALVQYRQHDANMVGAYRPLRQLRQLPRLVLRQRQVLLSQLDAVRSLEARLIERDCEVPVVLLDYLSEVGADSLRERMSALAVGRFAAPHAALRALRLVASIRGFR